MEINNPYLLRRLEESSNYFYSAYSFRYMTWKKFRSIKKYFFDEIKRRNTDQKLKILEIGCGDGCLIYRLMEEFSKRFNLEFKGVDINPLDIDFANQKKAYFQHTNCWFELMDANRLSFKDDEFDIVICSEVAEHLPQPELVISQIHRVLKKNGLFLMTTPQKNGSIPARLARILKRKRGDADFYIEGCEMKKNRLSSEQGKTGAGFGHISVKTKGEWLGILKKVGFKIIRTEGTGGIFFGNPKLDELRMLFSMSVILDLILEKFPFSYLWSELLIIQCRKC